MNKKIALLSLLALSTVSLVTALVVGSTYLESSASPFIFRSGLDICKGNHYEERSATEALPGCKEYWVCCNCHSHYLSSEALPEGSIWTDKGIATEIVAKGDDRYLPYNPGDGDFMLDYLIRLSDYALECNKPGYTTKQINSVYFSDETEELYVATLTNEDNLLVPISIWYGYAEGATTGEEFLDAISLDTSYSLIEEFDFSMGAPSPIDEYDLRDNDDFKSTYPGYSFKGSTLTRSASSYLFTGTGINNDEYTSVFMSSYDSSTGSYTNDYDYTESDTTTKAYLLLESIYNAMEDTPSPEPTPGGDGDFLLSYLKEVADIYLEYEGGGDSTTKDILGIALDDDNEMMYFAFDTNEDGNVLILKLNYSDVEVSTGEEFFGFMINDPSYSEAFSLMPEVEHASKGCSTFDMREDEHFKSTYSGYSFLGSNAWTYSEEEEKVNNYTFSGTGKLTTTYKSTIDFTYNPEDDDYNITAEYTENDSSTYAYQLLESIYNHLDGSPSPEPAPSENRLDILKGTIINKIYTAQEENTEKLFDVTINQLVGIGYSFYEGYSDEEEGYEQPDSEYLVVFFTAKEDSNHLYEGDIGLEGENVAGTLEGMLNNLVDHPEYFYGIGPNQYRIDVSDHLVSTNNDFLSTHTGTLKGKDFMFYHYFNYEYDDGSDSYTVSEDRYDAGYAGVMYESALDQYTLMFDNEWFDGESINIEETYEAKGINDSSTLSYGLAKDIYEQTFTPHVCNEFNHYSTRAATSERGGSSSYYQCVDCNKWILSNEELPGGAVIHESGTSTMDFDENDVRYIDFTNPKTETEWINSKLLDQINLKAMYMGEEMTFVSIDSITQYSVENAALILKVELTNDNSGHATAELSIEETTDKDVFLTSLISYTPMKINSMGLNN